MQLWPCSKASASLLTSATPELNVITRESEMSSVETRRNVRRRGILIKFIEEQRGNKYLNGAMTVLSKDEVDSFIEGYKSITTSGH